jgi:hypothetical protein
VRLCWRYLSQSVVIAARAPHRVAWRQLLSRAPAWYRSIGGAPEPIKDRIAWVTFGAFDFLQSTVRPDMRVLEFGAGGSTVFFLDRGAKLVTVEHEPKWAENVAEALSERQGNGWELHVVEPVPIASGAKEDPGESDPCTSSRSGWEGLSFERYASTVDRYPDSSFDLVLVDGRARPACFERALPKVRPGGFIVLDDAERPEYRPATALATNDCWRRRDFRGPGPYTDSFWQTSVWRRTAPGARA